MHTRSDLRVPLFHHSADNQYGTFFDNGHAKTSDQKKQVEADCLSSLASTARKLANKLSRNHVTISNYLKNKENHSQIFKGRQKSPKSGRNEGSMNYDEDHISLKTEWRNVIFSAKKKVQSLV